MAIRVHNQTPLKKRRMNGLSVTPQQQANNVAAASPHLQRSSSASSIHSIAHKVKRKPSTAPPQPKRYFSSSHVTDPFVKVFLSIRKPEDQSENPHQAFRYDVMQDEKTIQIHHPNSVQSFRMNRIFHMGGVLREDATPHALSTDLYNHTCGSFVQDCMNGYHQALIAYGQSGAGKTHSLFSKKHGVTWKILKDMFNKIDHSKNARWILKLSVMEIFDKQVNDLIGGGHSKKLRQKKDVGSFIDGVEEKKVSSLREAQRIIECSLKKRATQATNLNTKASRAHLMVRIMVIRKKGSDGRRVSKIDIVDLAGAMRMMNLGSSNFNTSTSNSFSDSNLVDSEKDHVSERSAVNMSLTALGKVILQLSKHGEQGYVSYRDSLLTNLLRDVLGGNCKTTLLACMSDHADFLEDSLSTLRFADRAKHIKNTPIPNEDSSPNVIIDDLREQLKIMQGECNSYTSTIHKYETQLQEQEQEVSEARELKQNMQRLEEDFASLQEQYRYKETEHELEIEQNKEKMEDYENQIQKIQEHSQEQVANLKEQVSVLQKTESELSQIKETQTSEIEKLNKDLEDAQFQKDEITTKMDEIVTQLKSEKESHSKTQSKLSESEAAYQNIWQKQKQEVEELKNKITSLESDGEDYKQKLEEQRKGYEEQLQQLRTEREESLKQYIAQQKENMMCINKQAREHQEEMDGLKKRQKEEIDALNEKHRQTIEKVESELKGELDLTQKHLNQQLRSASEENERIHEHMDEMKVTHSKELEEARTSLEDEIETIKHHNAKHLEDLNVNHQEEVKSILSMQKKKLNKLKEDYQASQAEAVEKQKNEDEAKLKSVQETHESEIAQLQKKIEDMQQQMQELKKQHESEMDALREDHSSEISSIKQSHEMAIATTKDEHQKEVEKQKKDFETKMEEQLEKHSSAIQDLKHSHQAEIKQTTSEHEGLLQKYDDKIDSLQSQIEESNKTNDKLRSRMRSHKEKLMSSLEVFGDV